MNQLSFRAIAITICVLSASIYADVKLPAIFGDHMVLQAGAQAPVWGWAEPGEKVSASIAGQKQEATAAADGKWTVHFTNLAATAQPIEVSVAGKNSIVIHDVMVGDVWLASGQSNMEFPLKIERNGKDEIPKADHPKIRFFRVPLRLSNDPQSDCDAKWEICTPESAAPFSAVAYYFAVEMQQKLGTPVGIIGSYQGGSIVQGWTSIEGFRGNESLKSFAEDYDAAKIKSAPLVVKYEQSVVKWEQAQKDWQEKTKAAQAEGKIPPPAPKGKKPENRALNYQTPSLMFNGMIAPIVPYAIKGILWYQGESDAHNMAEVTRYHALFPNFIKDWRRLWNNENLTVLFVQLPNYRKRLAEPGESVWAAMREVQTQALAIPHVGMAVTIDLGDVDKPENIHPLNKRDVASRLMFAARRTVFGDDSAPESPMFSKMGIEANKIRVTLTQGGKNPATLSAPSGKIVGFTIAGADKKFLPADATIDANGSVIVWNEVVKAPVAVRYGWADNPEVNLYGKTGLPVAPFRTDDWPLNDPPAPAPSTQKTRR